jgi:hypothetical protein
MIELNIPGRGLLQLHHLVLAVDGVLLAADLVATDIFTALDLLDRPLRIVASLRT